MTGPDHYRQAERLLAEAELAGAGTIAYGQLLTTAAVHAALAQAAAAGLQESVPLADWQAWHEAAGAKAREPAR